MNIGMYRNMFKSLLIGGALIGATMFVTQGVSVKESGESKYSVADIYTHGPRSSNNRPPPPPSESRIKSAYRLLTNKLRDA